VGAQFKKAPATDLYFTRWYIAEQDLARQEKLSEHLVAHFKKTKEVADEEHITKVARELYPDLPKETILEYVRGSKALRSNIYSQWGLSEWREVTPRGVKDKAYLVMKSKGEPLHFTEVATMINEANFSHRRALAQTVHNELIKDPRFVLVGRGLYALREWGYEEGTVSDIIKKVLKEKGPLEKEELVKAVLARRFVKPSTVILNLNSFKKREDNKYTLV
jgi:hypothetical protein